MSTPLPPNPFTDKQKIAIVQEARSLRSEEEGENPEYDRALVELAGNLLGFTQDDRPEVESLILGDRPSGIEVARRWITPNLRRFFEGELTNERNGGISPSTLNSAIDSMGQGGPEVFGLEVDDLTSLLTIQNLVPNTTRLTDLLAG